MLGFLHHLQAVLGRRSYPMFLILAGLGIFAFEYTAILQGISTAYQAWTVAPVAAPKMNAEVEQLRQQVAKLTEETRLLQAQTQVAPQRASGEANKAEGEGALTIAKSKFADDLAQAEARRANAEADKLAAETERAKAETRRAQIAAAKDLVECKKNGFILGHMTGEGCQEPDASGNVPTAADVAGFRNVHPEGAQNELDWLPRGEAEGNFKDWVRAANDSEGFAAYATSRNGLVGHGTYKHYTAEEAAADAVRVCGEYHGVDCRIMQTREGPPRQRPVAVVIPPEVKGCADYYRAWLDMKMTGPGAFAANDATCARTWNKPDKATARNWVLQRCQHDSGRRCKIIAER